MGKLKLELNPGDAAVVFDKDGITSHFPVQEGNAEVDNNTRAVMYVIALFADENNDLLAELDRRCQQIMDENREQQATPCVLH